MARRQGIFDDLMSIGLKLPWKVGVAAAAIIFVALHVVAIYTGAPVATNTLADLGSVVQHGLIHELAEFFQYIIPAGLLIGTTIGYFKQRQSGALFSVARASAKPTITSMSWRDFERLVGEVFRRQGFMVSGFGGRGPDGGVDLCSRNLSSQELRMIKAVIVRERCADVRDEGFNVSEVT
jgi:restriction system protein